MFKVNIQNGPKSSGTFLKNSVLQIRGVYPGSRVLIFTHPGSRILRSRILRSRIQKQQQKRGVKNFFCHTYLCSHKFHKIENYLSFEVLKKKIGPIFKEFFLPKNLSLSSQKYGFGIQDPRSRNRKKPIPDPGVKKAPDPGSGFATLEKFQAILKYREPRLQSN